MLKKIISIKSKVNFSNAIVAIFLLVLLCINFSGTPSLASGVTQYSYDTLGRVIKIIYPNGSYVIYAYDKAGNRITVIKSN